MSTKKRVSKPNMRESLKAARKAEPPLARSYRAAIATVCGHQYTKIKTKDHPKFRARQKQLDDIEVAYDTYSYTVVKSWWQWCKDQGMSLVPINLFLGKKAWAKFLEIPYDFIHLTTLEDDTWNAAVHTEITAARAFIGGTLNKKLVTIYGIRKILGRSTPSKEVIAESLRLLNLALGTNAANYNGIVYALKKRRNASTIRI